MGVRSSVVFASCALLLGSCAGPMQRVSTTDLQRQVADTERAFAQSMADRDYARFSTFIAEEAVFFAGANPMRGKAAVVAGWKRFFDKPEAPFSWQPEQVQVLDSSTLAISSGPVRDAKGKLFATFTSIWRLEAPGVWRIVFDKGNDACECEGK